MVVDSLPHIIVFGSAVLVVSGQVAILSVKLGVAVVHAGQFPLGIFEGQVLDTEVVGPCVEDSRLVIDAGMGP